MFFRALFSGLVIGLAALGALVPVAHSYAVAQDSTGGIEWMSNYEEALSEAKSKNLPLFLLFEGSDWCGWCKRLDTEVLRTPKFAELMGGKMVFVDIDFRMRPPLSAEQSAYNEGLKQKFGVSGFPTVILLDSQGRRLSTMGYLPGGPENYATQIEAIINR